MTKTIMIAHGSAAVQAARIIAGVSKDREDKARGYELAAQWHDRNAEDCEQMQGLLRRGSPEQKSAEISAKHHRSSAAVLRMVASNLLQPSATK